MRRSRRRLEHLTVLSALCGIRRPAGRAAGQGTSLASRVPVAKNGLVRAWNLRPASSARPFRNRSTEHTGEQTPLAHSSKGISRAACRCRHALHFTHPNRPSEHQKNRVRWDQDTRKEPRPLQKQKHHSLTDRPRRST